MKQMTPEEKAQYFGLYLEQEVAVYEEAQGLWALSLEFLHDVSFHDIPGYLSLRSIKQITDDEIIELERIRKKWRPSASAAVVRKFEFRRCEEVSQEIVDYLRSIGIATPWKQYSIQDLIDNGVLKIDQ